MRAVYEWQIRSKDQKLRDLQSRLCREEVERAQMQAEFERDREGFMRQFSQLVDAVGKYGIQVDTNLDQGRTLSGATGMVATMRSQLDSKMEQLSCLLHEQEDPPHGFKGGPFRKGTFGKGAALMGPKGLGKGPSVKGKGGCMVGNGIAASIRPDSAASCFGPAARRAAEQLRHPQRYDSPVRTMCGSLAPPPPAPRTASRHRVSFPDDAPQPPLAPDSRAWGETERLLRALERRSGSAADFHARRALEVLGAEAATEALRHLSDLVQEQNGRCTNLSAAVVSVANKVRQRGGSSASGSSGAAGAGRRAERSAQAALGAPASVALIEEEGSQSSMEDEPRAPAAAVATEPATATIADKPCDEGRGPPDDLGDTDADKATASSGVAAETAPPGEARAPGVPERTPEPDALHTPPARSLPAAAAAAATPATADGPPPTVEAEVAAASKAVEPVAGKLEKGEACEDLGDAAATAAAAPAARLERMAQSSSTSVRILQRARPSKD